MKEKVQVFGRFLSGMVMPNIGAFIAWGLITALFIETGWCPNEKLAQFVTPMSTVLLPLLIAYTGGSAVAGQRGGVIGAIATMGVIVGSDIPMFIGAMIVGPLAAWIIKKFDKAVEGHIKAGFEMLVNNFSLGIIGAILACLAMYGVAPLVTGMNSVMRAGVDVFRFTRASSAGKYLYRTCKSIILKQRDQSRDLIPNGNPAGRGNRKIHFLPA